MNPMQTLHILSGGAAHGLVKRLEADLAARGLRIEGRFGAVGAMRDALLAGAPCDLLVLSQALIDQLDSQGRLQPGSIQPVGKVRTGLAVPSGAVLPVVRDAHDLAALLRSATAFYYPDPVLATAGIHVQGMLRALGLEQELAGRLRTFPNGATAMRELAACTQQGAVGCTQFTEILDTPGVQLAGALPAPFELATVYTAAVPAGAGAPQQALQAARLLAGASATTHRAAAGFDPLG